MADLSTSDPGVAQTWNDCQKSYLNDYYKPRDNWQKALSTLVGIYSLVKQHQIMQEYLKLAKEQVKQAERYLALAESHYNTIAVPTYRCQKDLFTRYLGKFSGYECSYLEEAFRLKEYDPEYKLQEGRAISTVQHMFDKARLQRRRQVGKYNTGLACHDNSYFTVMQAQAKVSAVNHAYRFEENRKFKLDQWYWQKCTAGIGIVDSMGNRVVSGLNGGASVANQALNSVGNAYGLVQNAFQFVENGYTNLANFWGSVSNTAFQFAGYQYGRSQASPFNNGAQAPQVQQNTSNLGAVSSDTGSSGVFTGSGSLGGGAGGMFGNY